MIQSVEMIGHVSSTNVSILVRYRIPVVTMHCVKHCLTGPCVDARMDGEEILTPNVSNVG